MSLLLKAGVSAALLFLAPPAKASNILVSQQPWDWDYAVNNMADVFRGSFTHVASYASADAASVFSAANGFVFLNGGDHTDVVLATYLKTNAMPISQWVKAGGRLLIQSSGEHVPNEVAFAGVSLTRTATTPNGSGDLTAAGAKALTAFYVPPHPRGASLAEDVITGPGLTALMTGDDNGGVIVASQRLGRGTIVYSGLTDSEFHYPGPGGLLGDVNELNDAVIAFAASGWGTSTVPLPPAVATFALSLLAFAAAGLRWRTPSGRTGHPDRAPRP